MHHNALHPSMHHALMGSAKTHTHTRMLPRRPKTTAGGCPCAHTLTFAAASLFAPAANSAANTSAWLSAAAMNSGVAPSCSNVCSENGLMEAVQP